MSVNIVSNSNNTSSTESNTTPYAKFQQQYSEYKTEWENISSSDSFKNNESYLSEIKDKIKELLDELDKVVEEGYNENVVKEAMQALGALLKGTSTMMSLEVRLQCLEELLEAMENNKILYKDYSDILNKLDDPDILETLDEPDPEKIYSKEDFDKFYDNALKNYYRDHIEKLDPTKFKELTGEESVEDLKKIYIRIISAKVNEDFQASQNLLNEAKGKGATTAASLALKVIQANHQFKELDLENISDQKKEQDAQKNPMIKKLKNEGVWEENNTIDRHLEMLKEERINELRNPNRK